mmetsp:Transcript_102216/g.317957  ORF Transcript_102216/g.317957 Transcript_102216/m.317957 type:complete len:313 (+) Transcript_102216:1051-1989(+)
MLAPGAAAGAQRAEFVRDDPEEYLRQEQQRAREEVRHEYLDHKNPNELVEQEMHNDSPETAHIYGGAMSAEPQEQQLVQAWRPTPWGEWQLAAGVIHRVHSDDKTVTVQFVPDQHRVRVPFMSVKPVLDITPQYPTVRLAPGERLPTPAEIAERERNANATRERLGLPPDAPLPGTEDQNALLAGESMDKDGMVILKAKHWGIPAPTLDALRNRSIPPNQVTDTYGRHFYTDLYRNNFYAEKERWVSASGHVGVDERRRDPNAPHVISHTYIPLEGPELEQDMHTGKWYAATGQDQHAEPQSALSRWMWFLD